MGSPKEELSSWVAERNDNYREETKDKAENNAGKRESASRITWSFPLVWTKERLRKKSMREAAYSS